LSADKCYFPSAVQGSSEERFVSRGSRIVGGTPVNEGEFPSQVSVTSDKKKKNTKIQVGQLGWGKTINTYKNLAVKPLR
jgi:secreted trypsin-like serine protease